MGDSYLQLSPSWLSVPARAARPRTSRRRKFRGLKGALGSASRLIITPKGSPIETEAEVGAARGRTAQSVQLTPRGLQRHEKLRTGRRIDFRVEPEALGRPEGSAAVQGEDSLVSSSRYFGPVTTTYLILPSSLFGVQSA